MMPSTVLVKIGGSILRKESFAEAYGTISLIASLGERHRIVITNGSLDLPTVTHDYLDHLGGGDAKAAIRPRVRGIVAEYIAKLFPSLAMADSLHQIEACWKSGRTPVFDLSQLTRLVRLDLNDHQMNAGVMSYVAGCLLGVNKFLFLTDVDEVYIPRDAPRPARLVTTQQLRSLPTSCIDQGVAEYVELYGKPIHVMNGKNVNSVRQFFDNSHSTTEGSVIVPGKENCRTDIEPIISYLGEKSATSMAGVSRARAISEEALRSGVDDWQALSKIGNSNEYNWAAYTLAIALERVGAAFVTGVISQTYFLALCADQVCADWAYCRMWIESYRENDTPPSGAFRRRYAEFVYLISCAYLRHHYHDYAVSHGLPDVRIDELRQMTIIRHVLDEMDVGAKAIAMKYCGLPSAA